MDNLPQLLADCRQENSSIQARLEELTDFVENASIPLYWVDANGIITWANQAELDALGYTKEQYIGKPIANFHADAEVISDILTKLTNNETLRNYPARLVASDGSIRHVLISSNVLHKEGKFIHTRCFTKDVTSIVLKEQLQAKLLVDLEKSQESLRMAVELTGLGTWEYLFDTKAFTCSKQCQQIYGISTEAPMDFGAFLAGVHPMDEQLVRQKFNNLQTGPATFELTYRIIRANNEQMGWVKVQGRIYLRSDGSVERILGTILDISTQKFGEEKAAKLSAIIDSTDDAIVSKTLDGIVTSWNPAAQRIFGYTEEEMIGMPITMLIPHDRQEEEPAILSKLSQGQRVQHFETVRVRKDGGTIHVSLTISPIRNNQGQIIGLSKIARDISLKKEEEQRKNDFVAMVSHELKTPLTSISAYVQLLLAKAKQKDDTYNINALTKTDTQTKKMISMIKDFLSLARMEEGKLVMQFQEFELKDLITETTEDAQFLTSKHQIQVIDCEHIKLNADRDKLGQVLMNLLSNAIKYSPKGGEILIGCEKKDGLIKIFVKDSGIGISSEDQQHLFQRFYRVSNNSIKTASGFGIGLFLSSEILRLHGTEIHVQSELGEGSTFYFYFPELN